MIKRILAYIALFFSLYATGQVAIKIFYPKLISFNEALFFHFSSALLCFLSLYLLTNKKISWNKTSNLWWVFGCFFTTFIPLFGLLIILAVFIGQGLNKKQPPPIVEEEISIQNASIFDLKKSRSNQVEIMDRLDIAPFVDIFKSGSADLKKSAIRLLGNMKTKTAVKDLKMALLDNDIEVRLFAAGILGKMEDEYALQIKTLSMELEKKPTSETLALDLAKLYLQYTQSGLLEGVACTYYYEETIKILNKISQDPDILFMKARTYLALNNYEKALQNINECLSINNKVPMFYHLLWEIQFARQAYKDLQKELYLAKQNKTQGLNKEVLSFWT